MRKFLLVALAMFVLTTGGLSVWALSDKSTQASVVAPDRPFTAKTATAMSEPAAPLTEAATAPQGYAPYVPTLIPYQTTPITAPTVQIGPLPTYWNYRVSTPGVQFTPSGSCHAAAYVCELYGQ